MKTLKWSTAEKKAKRNKQCSSSEHGLCSQIACVQTQPHGYKLCFLGQVIQPLWASVSSYTLTGNINTALTDSF